MLNRRRVGNLSLRRLIFVGILVTLLLVYSVSRQSSRSDDLEASEVYFGNTPSDYAEAPPTSTPIAGQSGETYSSYSGIEYQMGSNAFLETFDGIPNRPLPWRPNGTWDIAIHSREIDTWRQMLPMEADGGANCEPSPAVHRIREYSDSVYQCDGHIMSAINGSAHAVAYLTPAVITEFSTETESIIRFDISTARKSNLDWVDLWITPYNDHMIYPLESWQPDLTGEPRRAIHIRMDSSWNSFWTAEQIENFQSTRIPGTSSSWQGYETFLTPDANRRDTFELRLSQTHIKFGMPEYDFWWIDHILEQPLSWSNGIVQFGHHSANVEDSCEGDADCSPNTWHWDNIMIDPAYPFTMLPADGRYVDASTDRTVFFQGPAPRGAQLRFAGIGNDLEVSFDGGNSWKSAELQAQAVLGDEKFKSYLMPVPRGTESVTFKGNDWWGGPWHVRDISIWGQ